jgi:hypothetical protein
MAASVRVPSTMSTEEGGEILTVGVQVTHRTGFEVSARTLEDFIRSSAWQIAAGQLGSS